MNDFFPFKLIQSLNKTPTTKKLILIFKRLEICKTNLKFLGVEMLLNKIMVIKNEKPKTFEYAPIHYLLFLLWHKELAFRKC